MNNQKNIQLQKLADIMFESIEYKGLYDPEGHNPEFGVTPKNIPTMRTAWILKKEPSEILMEMYKAMRSNTTNT